MIPVVRPATPLTKRDAWAGTFEHVVSRATLRADADCPAHLPAAPATTLGLVEEGAQPLNHLQREIAEVHVRRQKKNEKTDYFGPFLTPFPSVSSSAVCHHIPLTPWRVLY